MPVKIATIDDTNPSHQAALRGFANRLLKLRSARGLTQVDLAARIGSGRGSFAIWEKGAAIPDLATICLLAEVLEVSVTWLAFGVGKNPTAVGTMEERVVEIPLARPGRDADDSIFLDASNIEWMSFQSPNIKAYVIGDANVPEKYKSSDIIFVDSSRRWDDWAGYHLFEKPSGRRSVVEIEISGGGPMAKHKNQILPVDTDKIGNHRGMVVVEVKYPSVS